jgi:anthranilate phosphoribosyltransferase
VASKDYLLGFEENLADAADAAREAILSGHAMARLRAYVSRSQDIADS